MSETADLYQIALLIDQLKHDDLQLRVSASKGLCRIASALGPERTREELVPFLKDTTDDEDEVLLVIAEKLGELRTYVGGSEYMFVLLEPLQLLSLVDDSAVRTATTKSLEAIASAMTDEQFTKHYMTFVLELAAKDWFTARISASALFAGVYSRVPDQARRTWRSAFLRLCMDESPIVRRSALTWMGSMAQRVSTQDVLSEFLGVFTALANDLQDGVRIQVVPNCATLAQVVPREQQIGQILPAVLNIAADKSWRVRWALASAFHHICAAFGERITNDHLSAAFEALLNDAEAEVRSASAANISRVCTSLTKERVLLKILPVTQRLVTDSSEFARASLAAVINELAVLLGREDTVTHLLPMLLLLLRDEASDVRLSVISNLGSINKVVGIELLSQSLLPAIVDLSEDPKWRLRLAIIGHIPMLAEQLGKEFFSERLSALSMVWLGDDVYTVRRSAASNLHRLVELFGEKWYIEQIFPRVEKLHVHVNYLHRVTALYAIQALVSTLSETQIESRLLAMTTTLAKDPVANVRLSAAKTLAVLHSKLNATKPRAQIISLLTTLQTDTDRDVRYFATSSLKAIKV